MTDKFEYKEYKIRIIYDRPNGKYLPRIFITKNKSRSMVVRELIPDFKKTFDTKVEAVSVCSIVVKEYIDTGKADDM